MMRPIVVEPCADGLVIFQQRCGVCFLEAAPLYAAPLWVDPQTGCDRLLCSDCLRSGGSGIRDTLTARASGMAATAAELLRCVVDGDPDELRRCVIEHDVARWRDGRGTILMWSGDPAEPSAKATAEGPYWCATSDDLIRFAARGCAASLSDEAAHLLRLAEFEWQLPDFGEWSKLEAAAWARDELGDELGVSS